MKLRTFLVAALAASSFSALAESLDEMYPAPWQGGSNAGISQALAEEGIEGCAKYQYRVSSKSKSEFLVYCYKGKRPTWAYMVWPNIHKVLGPYAPDDSLL